jgi:hypothetical protein
MLSTQSSISRLSINEEVNLMARGKNKRWGICYLCGKEGIVTDDHVPPQCLAPLADDVIFYKLPAHESCNNTLSVHESRFRDFVVSASKDGVREAENAFENMQRNFRRRGNKEQSSFLNRDFFRLYENIERREGYTPGGIYVGPVVGIKPAQDLDYKSVLTKIARGLHYHHNGAIIPDNYDVYASFLFSDFERHANHMRHLNVTGQMGDFFAFRGTSAKDEPNSGIWYMCFYRSVIGMVGFRKPKELE